MKKSILTALMVSGLAFTANAQIQQPTVPSAGTGFYVGVHGGYNFGINSKGSPYLGAYETVYQSGPDPDTVVPFSLGKGANFGLNIGYMFTSNLGAELGVDYLLGSDNKFNNRDADFPGYSEQLRLSGKMIQFKPAVVFRAGTGNLKPYAKVGVVVGVGSKITSEYEEREPEFNYSYDWYEEYNGGTAVGFHGALGVDYALNNQMSLFGEVLATGLNYSPEKGKVTRYNRDGQDRLSTLNTNEREITFVDTNDNVNSSNTQPRKELKFSAPFSSVGLNVGVKYRF